MGYESRIIIVDRHEYGEVVFGEEIARVEMSCMGYKTMWDGKSFGEVFHTPIDFNLYGMAETWEDPNEVYPDEHYREDCYGQHCKWATVDEVKSWLENAKDDYDPIMSYRRAKILYGLLCALKANEDLFGQLCVVHYGH